MKQNQNGCLLTKDYCEKKDGLVFIHHFLDEHSHHKTLMANGDQQKAKAVLYWEITNTNEKL